MDEKIDLTIGKPETIDEFYREAQALREYCITKLHPHVGVPATDILDKYLGKRFRPYSFTEYCRVVLEFELRDANNQDAIAGLKAWYFWKGFSSEQFKALYQQGLA